MTGNRQTISGSGLTEGQTGQLVQGVWANEVKELVGLLRWGVPGWKLAAHL